MGKEKFPANVRPAAADVQEEEQSRFTGRTISRRNIFGVQLFEKKHLRNVDCLNWRIRASYLRRAVM
ncbi:unnamed protein product [Sphagnum troendelagicum]|jgi:hypothetical protein